MTRLLNHSLATAVFAAFLTAGCGPATPPNDDAMTSTPDASMITPDFSMSADATALRDMTVAPDATALLDLQALPDLTRLPDLTAFPDLAVLRDFAMADMTPVPIPDMTVVQDLTVLPDLSVLRDLTTFPDLTPPVDMTVIRDLTVVPKTVNVTVAPNGNLAFSPNPAVLRAGDTVTWTWAFGGHNVVSGANGTADNAFCSPADMNCAAAPTSNAGFKYSHTFNAAGTFNYFCAPHFGAGMMGSVIVQ